MTSAAISIPAGFAPAYAVGYSDAGGQLALVSDAAPLPVAMSAPAPAPLVGQSAASELIGPFNATSGRVIVVTLDGEWAGTVRLLRSTDGGLTRAPLRVGGSAWAEYTESGCEQAWTETEEGASFYLDIALDSGAVSYRVSQ
ncbi:MAG: hypothetical protein J2O44_00010 [Porphyrobacter sp.]|nr:hypothetical protein [Porphyrobacter sp.]